MSSPQRQFPIFLTNIESATRKNQFFRHVLYTSTVQQIVLMSIKPHDDIPLERHPGHDQFVRIEEGTGSLIIGRKQDRVYPLQDGDAFIIPAGTYHRIVNTSPTHALKLYTIYSPPEHPQGLIQKNKPKLNKSRSSQSVRRRY